MQTFEAITNSPSKQSAVLGHALRDRDFYARCQEWGVTAAWFNLEAYNQKAWTALVNFTGKHHRHPTAEEVRDLALDLAEDAPTTDRLRATCGAALIAAKGFGSDVLSAALREWATGQEIYRAYKDQIGPAYAAGDIARARDAVRNAAARLDRIEHAGAYANHFEPASVRAKGESEDRLMRAKKRLPFGVSFFDDVTMGIQLGDIVLVTARTGAGKTEFLTNVGRVNALNGTPVAMFALEAKNREIEQRIKYGELASAYKADRGPDARPVSFGEWMMGELEGDFAPYEKAACEAMDRLDRLHTFYRTNGDFDADHMERAILQVAEYADLIIVDHLHYIDTDSAKNENAELTGVMKRLETLTKTLDKPIVLAAHVRKADRGRMRSLVPDVDDVHGSSNVSKIAHTVLALAPCYQIQLADTRTELARSWATYMNARKTRMFGTARSRYTGIGFFDRASNRYHDPYAIGVTANMDTEWEPAKAPYWAKRGSVNVLPTDP